MDNSLASRGLTINREPSTAYCAIACDGAHEAQVSDLALIDAPAWCLVVGGSDGTRVNDLVIRTPGNGAATDGIDLRGGSHVRDVVVEDCILGTFGGHGMEIGHEPRKSRWITATKPRRHEQRPYGDPLIHPAGMRVIRCKFMSGRGVVASWRSNRRI